MAVESVPHDLATAHLAVLQDALAASTALGAADHLGIFARLEAGPADAGLRDRGARDAGRAGGAGRSGRRRGDA